jgi:hypothetical protein
MQKVLLVSVVWALALAGCSGGDGDHKVADVTCPDGTVVTSEQIEAGEGHHEAGFDPMTLCPVPPSVTLSGLPATIQVYRSAAFTWVVDPGSITAGHSMLTSIRYAKASIPDAELTEGQMTKYPTEIIKKEHQNLPVTFKGNMTFNQPGKVYVRAYAQVQGEGAPRRDVWSPEVVLEVLPVLPTGVVQSVTHALGPVGELDPKTVDLQLGDAVKFVNEDFLDHTLELVSAPPGAEPCELAAGMQGGESATCVLIAPGQYEFVTDDAPTTKSLTVNVAQP